MFDFTSFLMSLNVAQTRFDHYVCAYITDDTICTQEETHFLNDEIILKVFCVSVGQMKENLMI